LLELDEIQKQKMHDIHLSNINFLSKPEIIDSKKTKTTQTTLQHLPTWTPSINNISKPSFNIWGGVPLYNSLYNSAAYKPTNYNPFECDKTKYYNTKCFKTAIEPELMNLTKNNINIPDKIKEKPIIKNKININTKINNINDLIKLTDDYPNDPHTEYNINIALLHDIKEPLLQLNHMIGMKQIKENIVDQL
jgi:hypothetical protein